MSKANILPEPWERQKGENAKRFEAFQKFRDMPNRSISQVARELSKSRQLIQRWAGEDKWHDRVAAWDDEQDRIARQAQIDEIKRMRKRHADLASAMLVKAAKALKNIPEEEINGMTLSKMVETASKLERISRGDVGEVVEERDGGEATPVVRFYMPSNHRDEKEEEEE
jgi:hypothetical protein